MIKPAAGLLPTLTGLIGIILMGCFVGGLAYSIHVKPFYIITAGTLFLMVREWYLRCVVGRASSSVPDAS